MKGNAWLISLLFPICASAQVYRCDNIHLKLAGEYLSVDGTAYIDYNVSEKYVELLMGDTVRHYNIRKARRQKSQQRFIVEFRGTHDLLFWNTEERDALICSFRIRGLNYWFKELSPIERELYSKVKTGLQEKGSTIE